MDFENDLKTVVIRIESQFKELTHVYAGALLREHVREFAAGTLRAYRLVSSDPVDDRAVTSMARRLCELSREIIFAADGERLPAELKKNVSTMYSLAHRTLKSRNPDINSELGGYCSNILKRSCGDDPWASINLVDALQVSG